MHSSVLHCRFRLTLLTAVVLFPPRRVTFVAASLLLRTLCLCTGFCVVRCFVRSRLPFVATLLCSRVFLWRLRFALGFVLCCVPSLLRPPRRVVFGKPSMFVAAAQLCVWIVCANAGVAFEGRGSVRRACSAQQLVQQNSRSSPLVAIIFTCLDAWGSHSTADDSSRRGETSPHVRGWSRLNIWVRMSV